MNGVQRQRRYSRAACCRSSTACTPRSRTRRRSSPRALEKAQSWWTRLDGIGVIPTGVNISTHNILPGDAIIINGELGNHGTAILIARGELALETDIESDCQPLNSLVDTILNSCPEVHAMRDATRGGLATVLNEFAQSAQVGIRLHEQSIPIREEVKGVCEILGLDPLYLANEGKLVVVVESKNAETVLSAMKSHPAGIDACLVGEVIAEPPGIVFLQTTFGTERIIDMLVGEQLPRIC